ncbi:hypothetical protein KEH57_04220 [Burkholderia cenocepacia]|uniref:hypothetical protein n=1 Tax=Burkholderia cenocepacia TaxID=95486 RepID=UPI001BA993D4|nr:hypothetical protein [Burkholderia cenocepacia]QUO26141.1 hypothetical protein KEH57_04220 [Burkholderia cenocepacia]
MRRPSIVRLSRDVERSAFDLGACHAPPVANVSDAMLHIRYSGCSSFERDRLRHGHRVRAHDRPEFHVPALEIDASGAIVFAWGDLWHRLTPGLYDATLTVCARPVARLRIEFSSVDRPIEAVTHVAYTECVGGFHCDDGVSRCTAASDCNTYVPAYDVPVRGDA